MTVQTVAAGVILDDHDIPKSTVVASINHFPGRRGGNRHPCLRSKIQPRMKLAWGPGDRIGPLAVARMHRELRTRIVALGHLDLPCRSISIPAGHELVARSSGGHSGPTRSHQVKIAFIPEGATAIPKLRRSAALNVWRATTCDAPFRISARYDGGKLTVSPSFEYLPTARTIARIPSPPADASSTLSAIRSHFHFSIAHLKISPL